jgi:hypothetical protein
MRYLPFALSAALLLAAGFSLESQAQQVTVGTPFHTLSDSFFEHNGVTWGGNWRGMNFSFGNASLASPQFGNFNPGAGLSTNYSINTKNFQANFLLSFSQGYHQSSVTQAPSVTMMNGQTGTISDTSLTPFVISQIPVVGAFPIMPNFSPVPPSMFSLPDPTIPRGNPRVQELLRTRLNQNADADDGAAVQVPNGPQAPPARPNAVPRPVPNGNQVKVPQAAPAPAPAPAVDGHAARLAAAQASSAGRAAPSVAEARRMHEQEKAAGDGDTLALLERARAAEDDGKPGVARVYYQMVIRRADGEVKQQAQERLDAIRGTGNP